MSQGVGLASCLPKTAWPPTYTDMAKEMVTYSKNNILAQAGQSMLAQANQATAGVTALLR